MFGYSETTGKILYIASVLLPASLIIRAIKQKNIIFIILSIFIFSYTYVTHYTFMDGIPISFHTSFIEPKYIYKSSLVHLLFLIIFCYGLRIPKQNEISSIQVEDNSFLFYLNITIAFIAMIFGRSGSNIFQSGGYGSGEVTISSLNEYFLIFYIGAFLFRGSSKNKLRLTVVLGLLYALKNLLFGGRVEVIMLTLCLIVLHFQFKFKLKTLFILMFCGMVFLNFYGNVRSNPLQLTTSKWYTLLLPKSANKKDLIVSQEGDVNHASSRMIGMVDNDIITPKKRLTTFPLYVLSAFVPGSWLPPISNLSSYESKNYTVGGGGLISGFFYVYGSYLGVILIALYLSYFLSNLGNSSKRIFVQLYILFLIITLPRWFAYNPIGIIKYLYMVLPLFIYFISWTISGEK